MTIFNIFSKRNKKANSKNPEIYTYDTFPETFRVQVVHIWTHTIGDFSDRNQDHYKIQENYKLIVDALCSEYGVFELFVQANRGRRDYLAELANFFLQTKEALKVLDCIELSFEIIDKKTRDYNYLYRGDSSVRANDAISELNHRFKEHKIGYQFIENKIIRIDSEMLHVEAVKPALKFLNQKYYEGAQQEFLSAFDHHRHGRSKEALNDCLKALESTMKSICDKRKWKYDKSKANASDLIKLCLEKELIPSFWQQHFSSLRSMLESSVPTGRNKLSGHGQGSEPTIVPDYLVSYMLHMTASSIVFLSTAEENFGKH